MPSGAVQFRIVRYPLWISVMQSNGNPQHPVSANFSGLDLYWPSPLELHPSDKVRADALFTSTPEAWVMRGQFYTSPEVPYLLEKDAAETKGKKDLGAALAGEFQSFFKGSAKPYREGSEEALPDMPQYANQSRIIVVGDVDFTTNMINATNARQNLDFLLRAADWLVSDDDIIKIRSKQPHVGRLDKIIDSDRRASAMRFVQIVNVGIIPVLVIAAGFFLAMRRKKRSLDAESL